MRWQDFPLRYRIIFRFLSWLGGLVDVFDGLATVLTLGFWHPPWSFLMTVTRCEYQCRVAMRLDGGEDDDHQSEGSAEEEVEQDGE